MLITQTRCIPTQGRKHPQPYPIMFTLVPKETVLCETQVILRLACTSPGLGLALYSQVPRMKNSLDLLWVLGPNLPLCTGLGLCPPPCPDIIITLVTKRGGSQLSTKGSHRTSSFVPGPSSSPYFLESSVQLWI